jgi:hypothetical protein
MNKFPLFGTQVKTPYGVGKVQGRKKDLETGEVQLFVNLPVTSKFTDEMKHAADGRPMVLWVFDLKDLEVVE